MTRLSLYFLGTPRIEVDAVPISIGHSKAIALLAYLAVTGQRYTRESLADFLWPTYAPASALGEVRRMLYALNKALGKGWLSADRQTIAVESQPRLWTDTSQFHHLLNQWEVHGHTANEVCPACLEPLTEAVALVQDDFLAGFTLPDCPAFDDWQVTESQLLRRELGHALEKIIQLLLHSSEQEPRQAIPYAERLLALDPLYEPAHRILMALFALTNQSSAAFQQYQECVHILRAELDISPAEATTALYKNIRLGAFDPTAVFKELPGFAGPSPPKREEAMHNLPPQMTPFVGREFELTALSGILLDPELALVSIVAPGGMGKSRLAVELGSKMVGHFKNGVFFVEMAPINNKEHIIPAVAEAIGYQYQQNGRSQQQQILDYLGNKEMLLILDNFDHLVDGGDIVSEMLKSAAGLKILVTSRQRLYQSGETLFTLHGLRLPDLNKQGESYHSAALELFQQTARRARPDFVMTPENLPDVIQICRLVQGMPLGIMLAAPWVTVLSTAEIATEIQRGLDILEAEGSELPERLRSIRAVFDHAWSMMTSPEQEVFMKLAVFRGGFTRQAGEMVANAGLRQLQSLVNKVLVERDSKLGRYQIHELLRQYAIEKLHQSDHYQQVYREYTRYHLSNLAQLTSSLKNANQLAALKLIEIDFENIRESWDAAIRNREYDLIGGALEAIYLFCSLRSRLEDGRMFFDKAREGLAPEPGQEPHPVWLAAGIRFFQQPKLRNRLESALKLARGRGDQLEAAFCLQSLAVLDSSESNPSQAILYYEECAALYRQLGEKYYLAQILSKLGQAHQMLRQIEKSFNLLNEAYQLQREIGDQIGESETLGSMGMLAYLMGQHEAMIDFLEKSYTIQLQTNYLAGQASNNLYRGMIIFRRGEVVAGRDLVQNGLDLATEIVDYSTQSMCLATLSYIDSSQGEYAKAEAALRSAESLETNPDRQTGASNPFLQLQINFAKSLLASGQGDFQTVRHYLGQIMKLAVMTASQPYMTLFLPVAAIIFARNGRPEWAVELLGLVHNQPIQLTGWMSKWILLNQVQAELVDKLGGTAYQAAWERGKSLELKAISEQVLQEIERTSR